MKKEARETKYLTGFSEKSQGELSAYFGRKKIQKRVMTPGLGESITI